MLSHMVLFSHYQWKNTHVTAHTHPNNRQPKRASQRKVSTFRQWLTHEEIPEIAITRRPPLLGGANDNWGRHQSVTRQYHRDASDRRHEKLATCGNVTRPWLLTYLPVRCKMYLHYERNIMIYGQQTSKLKRTEKKELQRGRERSRERQR